MPKQDKVQRINQRRVRPTDTLGIGNIPMPIETPPGSISVTTLNEVLDGSHTHEVIASSDPGEAAALLKTNPDGELKLYWLESDGALFTYDVDIMGGDLYVDGNADFGSGSEYLKLDGAYFGAYTTQYCYTWLQSNTEDEVWDFSRSKSWSLLEDGDGAHFTFRGSTVYQGSSGAQPALVRWHWWAEDVTQETYKGAAGIALLKGTGSTGDGTEEMVLSLVAGGDHTLKLQDNAGSTKLSITDSDDAEVASIDSDGLLTALGIVSGGHLLPSASETYDLGSPAKLWRSGYLSELRAVLFAEETVQLVGGWLIVPKDAGTFETDVAATDTTIDFGKTMTPGHWVLVRSNDASTGMPAAEYITVGSLVSGTIYNVTRNVDGSGANDWAAGTPFLVLGEEGDGRIELNAYDTPRIQILQQGASYNLADEVVRIGDLDGSFGITTERYGIGMGDYADGNYLRYDPVNGFLLSAGGGEVIIDENGITVGYDADTAMRFEADSGGTKHDVIYHDAAANALHIKSATRFWEIMETQEAKLAADGAFYKFHERPDIEQCTNGGFETAGTGGNTFANWTDAVGDGAITDETGSVHEGSHACKITAGPSANTFVEQTMGTSLAGLTIKLGFWTRGDGINSGWYRVWGNGYGGLIIPDTSTGVVGTTWTYVSTSFTCPTGTTSIKLILQCYANGGYAMFDSVSVAIDWGNAVIALGDADNNWVTLGASLGTLDIALGDGSSPTPLVKVEKHRLYPITDNSYKQPQMLLIGAETDAGKYLDFLYGAKYLWANLAAYNVDTGASIGHCICEIARPDSGNVDRYFTSDKTYVSAESGQLYLRLRSDSYAILYNTSAAKVRWVGWVMYYTA